MRRTIVGFENYIKDRYDEMKEEYGFSSCSDFRHVILCVTNYITQEVLDGKTVATPVGTFWKERKKAYIAHNPKTGKEVKVPAQDVISYSFRQVSKSRTKKSLISNKDFLEKVYQDIIKNYNEKHTITSRATAFNFMKEFYNVVFNSTPDFQYKVVPFGSLTKSNKSGNLKLRRSKSFFGGN